MTKIVTLVFLALLIIVLAASYKSLIKAYRALRAFIEEVRVELAKVSWPTGEEVMNSTILVFGFTIILTVLIGIADRLLGWCVRLILT